MRRLPMIRLPFSARSLRAQLVFWVALPVAIGLFAVSLTELRSHEQAMHQLVQDRADNLTRAAASLLSVRLDREKDRLLQIGADPLLHGSDSLALSQRLQQAGQRFDGELVLYAGDGSILARRATSNWATSTPVVALITKVVATDTPAAVTLRQEDAGFAVIVAVPIPVVERGARRVLAGVVPATNLMLGDVLQSLVLGKDMLLTVHSADGIPLARFGNLSVAPPEDKWVTASATVVSTGWEVDLEESWVGLAPPILRFENVIFVVVAMAVIISLLSAFFGLRNIVQPLQKLDAAASRLGWGDFDAIQAPVGGVQEIEDLQGALAGMAEQLRRHQEELQGYIGAMTLGQEEERKRLARELHDDTVQALIALNQQAELIERRLASDPPDAARRLAELRPLIGKTIADLRRQIHDLRPLYLEDLGFVPALEMLMRQVCERSGLIGDFECTRQTQRRLPPSVEISGFRIVQEALRNVATHAQASWVHVEAIFDATGITLRVEDDGAGFHAPNHPFHLAEAGHYGLLGMRERAELHGGWLRVETEPGRGTTLTAWLAAPVNN